MRTDYYQLPPQNWEDPPAAFSAIVAVDRNWAIGREGQLLCPISADLKRFKRLTMGHPVILGRKTLATFPGSRPLPARRNFILSRNAALEVEGALVFHSVDELLDYVPKDSVVIGGEQVYRALLDHCDRVYVTKIMRAFDGADAFFPDLDEDPAWHVTEESPLQEENGVTFRYVTYERVR